MPKFPAHHPDSRLLCFLCVIALGLHGCALAPRPQRGGGYKATRSSGGAAGQPGERAGGVAQRETEELTQPENPGSAATQNSERQLETTLHIPAASRIVETTRTTDEAGKAVEITRTIVPAAATTQNTRSLEKKGTVIGAAQKDTSRELATRLASMRPVQFAGIVLILAALAMFHPVVRAITASGTLQMVTGATGLALVFAPLVVAGHEATILFAGLGLVAVWFFVHRHGRLQGIVDANHDGIDDRKQAGQGDAGQPKP